MIVEETFYRRDEVRAEPRTLPATTYNSRTCCWRALRVDACSCRSAACNTCVLDNEEFIFVDREGGRMIEIAWQHFGRASAPRSMRRWLRSGVLLAHGRTDHVAVAG